MKIFLLPLLCLLSNNLHAQTDSVILSGVEGKGINWITGLTWEQIKQKAKQENKYIFVDAYATWCVPCKKMDKEVYTDAKVGMQINEKFISVKIQMDSTEKDGEEVKKWYPVAQRFKSDYKVSGYPSFLFFDKDGELVHQDLGLKNVGEFVTLVADASNPLFQDAKAIESYKQGNKDASVLLHAALAAKKNKDRTLADTIAREYKRTYLDTLTDQMLFTRNNIAFIWTHFYFLAYEEGSNGRFFKYIFTHQQLVDSLFNKGYSERFIKNIITWDELSSKLFIEKKPVTQNPDWDSLKNIISGKTDYNFAHLTIEEFKPKFYLSVKNWSMWVRLFEEKYRIYKDDLSSNSKLLGGQFDDHWALNSNAWTLFLGCYDNGLLEKSLVWVNHAIKLQGKARGVVPYYDTKANLLYKLGKRKKAIKVEKQALELEKMFLSKEGKQKSADSEEFANNINKMKLGKPTWPQENSVTQ